MDISSVLLGKRQQVVNKSGQRRESLFWHFPHNSMRAAIRKADFKLYRHFKTETHSLFRLYENGQLADIEEQKDLSGDPQYAAILSELSAELDRQLTENNAIPPHLNPHYRSLTLPSAKIQETSFDKSSQEATATLSEGPTAASAYVLYLRPEGFDTKKKSRSADYSEADPEVGYEVKIDATIDPSGRQITAPVPKEVTRVRFLIVDENNYQHFTEPMNVSK